ncbi:MAG: hypothetical protein QOG86_142, partial [Thermoleophilaceae bacterium]|nr:hypothetical protein [Thermoleophilaceae bacterium]
MAKPDRSNEDEPVVESSIRDDVPAVETGTRADGPAGSGHLPRDRASTLALVFGVAAVTSLIGFEAGGYFPGTTSIAAIGFAVALILRVGLARHPLEGFTRRFGVAFGSLALFALWTLISAQWSDAPGRAVLEANRVLVYLGALALFGSLVRRRGRLAAFAGGLALGSIVVSTAGLLTRVLPAVFPIAPETFGARLSYPLTYWNAAGLLAAVGILVSLGLSAAERLPRSWRAAIAGAIPVLAATLVLTFSRGAIAAGLVGLVILCAVCPTRTLL